MHVIPNRIVFCGFIVKHDFIPSGWLEFLLDPLVESKTTVTVPVIDIIEEKTLEYRYTCMLGCCQYLLARHYYM